MNTVCTFYLILRTSLNTFLHIDNHGIFIADLILESTNIYILSQMRQKEKLFLYYPLIKGLIVFGL